MIKKGKKGGPGPAFQTSFDNRYTEGTVFASDNGRVKVALNTNQQTEDILKGAERPRFLSNLK